MRRDTNHEISDEVDDFYKEKEEGEEDIELDDLGDRER